MRYIKELRSPLVAYTSRITSVDYSMSKRFSAVLSDGQIVEPADLLASDIIGVCAGSDLLGGVVMSLTAKEAKFHDFIESCFVTTQGFASRGGTHMGLDGTVIREYEYDKDKVVLFSLDSVVGMYGVQGSVIVRRDNSGMPEAFTLYDTLCWLCHKTGRFLMQYKTIKLFNRIEKAEFTINLVHSSEATRFFTKMLLDVNAYGVRVGSSRWRISC